MIWYYQQQLSKMHGVQKKEKNSWKPAKVACGTLKSRFRYSQLAEKANLLMRDCHISPFLLFSMLFMLYLQQLVSPEFSTIERFFTIHCLLFRDSTVAQWPTASLWKGKNVNKTLCSAQFSLITPTQKYSNSQGSNPALNYH